MIKTSKCYNITITGEYRSWSVWAYHASCIEALDEVMNIEGKAVKIISIVIKKIN